MVLCRHIDAGANQSKGILSTLFHIIRTAAYLEAAVLSCIYPAKMQMGFRDGVTFLYQTNYYIINILSDLILFLHLETAGKQLFFQFIRCYII